MPDETKPVRKPIRKPETIAKLKEFVRLHAEAKLGRPEIARVLGVPVAYLTTIMRLAIKDGYLPPRDQTFPQLKEATRLAMPRVYKLYAEGLTLVEIADATDITLDSVFRLIKASVEKGIIEQRQKPSNAGKRQKRRRPSRAGRAAAVEALPDNRAKPPPIVLALSTYIGPVADTSPLDLPATKPEPASLTCEWIMTPGRPWTPCGKPAERQRHQPCYCDEHRNVSYGRWAA